MRKDRKNLYSGNARDTVVCRRAWKEKEISRTVTLCPGALVNQTALFGWRHVFFLFLPNCCGINIKLRMKSMESEGTNSNYKWRNIGLSDLPSIILRVGQFLTAIGLTNASHLAISFSHGEGSFLLCVILSKVMRFAISSCQEKRSSEMSIIKNPNYSFLADSHSPVSIGWLSPGEGLLWPTQNGR